MSPIKQLKRIFQIIIPLLLAVTLFFWAYHDLDFATIWKVFKGGINYEWFVLSFVLSVASMVLRGLRWQQLVEPVCPGGRRKVIILSVFVSYAANLIFPRAGEVARCGMLKRADGLSFTKTLGTVVTERMVDVVCLALIALFTVIFQVHFFQSFFHRNPSSLVHWVNVLSSPILWIGLLTPVAFIFFFRPYLKRFGSYARVHGFISRLWEGMRSVTTLKNPFLFVFQSFLIWGIYFLMFYIGKYFFSFEVPLGVLAMLSGFVMGSFGVAAPIQGGIGAYHFMVIYTLVFYGMSGTDAGIFALVIHGLQTVITLVTGLVAYIWMHALYPKKVKQ